MEAKGNNILIKPEKKESILPSGIIIPDTAKRSNKEWGIITSGGEKLLDSYLKPAENGMRVLFFNTKCFEEDGIKLVPTKNCIRWE